MHEVQSNLLKPEIKQSVEKLGWESAVFQGIDLKYQASSEDKTTSLSRFTDNIKAQGVNLTDVQKYEIRKMFSGMREEKIYSGNEALDNLELESRMVSINLTELLKDKELMAKVDLPKLIQTISESVDSESKDNSFYILARKGLGERLAEKLHRSEFGSSLDRWVDKKVRWIADAFNTTFNRGTNPNRADDIIYHTALSGVLKGWAYVMGIGTVELAVSAIANPFAPIFQTAIISAFAGSSILFSDIAGIKRKKVENMSNKDFKDKGEEYKLLLIIPKVNQSLQAHKEE